MNVSELTHRVLQEKTRDGHAQGSHMAARVEFDPATFWTQGTEPTTEPPRI